MRESELPKAVSYLHFGSELVSQYLTKIYIIASDHND